jgi:Spy/CpxP family protein refolding chaperone
MKGVFMTALRTSQLLAALAGGALLLQGCSAPKTQMPPVTADQARGYFEVLRSEFSSGKTRALNETMKLTVAEADKFWPIYRDYDKDLAPVSERKLAMLREFVTRYKDGSLTDEKSRELTAQWLQNAQDRLDLWKKYSDRISEALSPVRGAQFLQVENQMALYVDISIAGEMPLIGSTPKGKQ